MRILFVDDHQEFATTVAREFLADHDVTFAADVRTGKHLLATRPFDLLLIDHDLPDGVGTEVIAHARALALSLDIIAISSHDPGNTALESAGARTRCPKLRFHEIAARLAP